MTSAPGFRTVLLVGFMGSGKTTVGRYVARLLDWELVDLDDVLEERFGMPVESIFRRHGEAEFRKAEDRAAREALRVPRRVVAPGGGWGGVPGRLRELDPRVLTVWLQVSVATAVERARADARARPLLDVPDPRVRARRLLESREPAYRTARLHLDSEKASPERLARDIVAHVRAASPDDGPPNEPDLPQNESKQHAPAARCEPEKE